MSGSIRFLIIQAVSGYVRVTTGGFPIEALQALGIPPLLPKAEGVARAASTVHSLSVVVLMVYRRACRGCGVSWAGAA